MRIQALPFLLGLFLISQSFGQESQTKGWTAVEYALDINKKWSVDFSQHFRMKEDFSLVDSYITQTELYFKPVKKWKLSAQFRYMNRNDTNGGIQGFENMLRYRVGVEKKFKIKPGNLEFRLAFQDRFSLDREDRRKKEYRIRPLFEWKIKNWSYDPKFFMEYIKELEGDLQESVRFGVGTKLKFGKQRALGIRYFYQKSSEAEGLDRYAHVVSLKYGFEKPKSEKKKKKQEGKEIKKKEKLP